MTITALPAPPSRQDPVNFAVRGDEFMAALPVFVDETNEAAATVNAQQITAVSAASTATTKASEATSARDIAMAAANYKGLWTSLSGAIAIPASAFHSGAVWMLLENVANVAAETPGVSSKWLNVTPATGLGTAAYADETDFQPAIGALTGLLISAGSGTISAATAAQIVAAIGSVYVANATHATSASSADSATSIMDGAVSSAAKIANGIITWAKMVTVSAGKLIGSQAAGAPGEISIGAGLQLTGGQLSCTVTDTGINPIYVTTPSALSNSSVQTMAHGLGGTPNYLMIKLVVEVANNGWSVGDVIGGTGMSVSGVANEVVSIGADSANIIVGCGTGSIAILNKTTGAFASVAVSNFKIEVGVSM